MFPDYPPVVPNMLAALTARYAERPQIIDAADRLTFAEVEAASARLARGLLARGLGKGARVGLLLPNGAAYVAAWFAITRIGAIAVQLSTFAKPRELAYVLRHSDCQLLLTADRYLSHDYVERLETAISGLAESHGAAPLQYPAAPYLREIWVFGQAPRWARGDRAELEAGAERVGPEMLTAVEAVVHPSDAAIMIYTSGSTSDPKAVVHTHGSAVRQAYVMAQYVTYQPGDRVLATSPLFWVGGLCTSLLTANINGAALVTPMTQAPEDIVGMIRRHGVTHTTLAVGKARALVGVDGFSEAERRRLKPIAAQQLALFGLAPPELTPDALGMSETFGPHSMELAGVRLPPDRVGSFGRAVPGLERKIIDPKTGSELEPGQTGELCVRGYCLMNGYYKKEPREVFDADGWFHTGDLCAIQADGHLMFHGRGGEMLKTSGANVAPREVELVLLEHPQIAEAAVIGVPDRVLGERVVAVIVAAAGGAPSEAALKAWLQSELASYKVPKAILTVAADDIPRTATGKVRKPELVGLARDLLARAAAAAD